MKRIACFALVLLLGLAAAFAFASELPADGQYTIAVRLSGGSGRASVQSPAVMTVQNGAATATLVWSSSNYTYMRIGDTQYDAVTIQPGSTFEIPVTPDEEISFVAQTTAMGTPHEIAYTLFFDSSTVAPFTEETIDAVEAAAVPDAAASSEEEDTAWRSQAQELGNGWEAEMETELVYARHFAMYTYPDGYQLIALSNGSRFLIIPEGHAIPEGLDSDIVTLYRPVGNIYLAATSAASLFDAIGALDCVTLSGTKEEGWYNAGIRAAMEDGRILYAGKYSAPDYELILASGCSLAVESLMINHAPKVAEKLQEFGIPVLIDLSSLEPHPLGRTEWMKLYAALTGTQAEADRVFAEQMACVEEMTGSSGKTVVFFYINTSGNAVVRKSGDYIAKMIELAGGQYIFENLGDSTTATASITLEMEQFYAGAKDADVLIYNSTIGGEIQGLAELLQKNALLADFKAVKTGDVWCTRQNMYQETTRLGSIIADMRKVLTGGDPSDITYLFKLD